MPEMADYQILGPLHMVMSSDRVWDRAMDNGLTKTQVSEVLTSRKAIP